MGIKQELKELKNRVKELEEIVTELTRTRPSDFGLDKNDPKLTDWLEIGEVEKDGDK